MTGNKEEVGDIWMDKKFIMTQSTFFENIPTPAQDEETIVAVQQLETALASTKQGDLDDYLLSLSSILVEPTKRPVMLETWG